MLQVEFILRRLNRDVVIIVVDEGSRLPHPEVDIINTYDSTSSAQRPTSRPPSSPFWTPNLHARHSGRVPDLVLLADSAAAEHLTLTNISIEKTASWRPTVRHRRQDDYGSAARQAETAVMSCGNTRRRTSMSPGRVEIVARRCFAFAISTWGGPALCRSSARLTVCYTES